MRADVLLPLQALLLVLCFMPPRKKSVCREKCRGAGCVIRVAEICLCVCGACWCILSLTPRPSSSSYSFYFFVAAFYLYFF